MIIGVDLDGVVVDFQNTWAELYIEYFDHWIAPEALDKYDALLDETHFENIQEFYAWFHRASGWHKLPYLPGSRGGVDAILAAGHEVRFITARPWNAKIPTDDWLMLSPWSGTREVRLHVLSNGESKGTIKCDIYIDDTPSVIDDLVKQAKQVIVFDQAWNRDVHNGHYVRRARDWDDVVQLVDSIPRQQAALLELSA